MQSRFLSFAALFASVTLQGHPLSSASEPATSLEAVRLPAQVVTAARTIVPLVDELDPRAPAQPFPAHDGADILKSAPGFSVIRKGGTDGDPVFRGLAGSRLGVQVDGEFIFGGCGNRMDPPTAYVFPTAYDRVTIVKGPQTVLYGPGNSAGVVLFERDLNRLEAKEVRFQGGSTVASFGRVDGLVDAGMGNPLLQLRGIGTYTRADDYEDGAGNRVHSAYHRWSANADLVWTPDSQTFFEISAARSDGQAAYADRAMDGVAFDRVNVAVRVRKDHLTPLITRVEVRSFYNYVDHVMDNYSLRVFSPSMMMPNRSVSNPDRRTAGGVAQVVLEPVEALVLRAGVDTQLNRHSIRSTINQSVTPYDTAARLRDAEFRQYGLYSEGTYTLARGTRVISGGRFDRWTAEDGRPRVSISAMNAASNPSYGRVRRTGLSSGFVRYEQDVGKGDAPVTLFTGIGRVQRFPDYWELIRNESLSSVSAFGTEPETTHQVDAGVLQRNEKLELSVSVFAAQISDYMLVESNVAKASGLQGTRAAVVTRNVDAATLGGEAAAAWRFAEHWKADVSLAYVRGENETDDRPLAQMTPLEARVAVAYASTHWSAGGLVRSVAAQRRVAVNQGNIVGQDIGPSAGFTLVSLHASRRLGGRFRVAGGIDNLFDRTYAEHLSRGGSEITGFVRTMRVNEPGRGFWMKMDAEF